MLFRSGYRDFTTTVAIKGGSTTNVNVEFAQAVAPAPVASEYTVAIRSSVSGARIFVDGEEAGTIRNGGLDLQLDGGTHEIVMVAPGYRTFVSSYNITKNGQITINPTR